ncbi:hypothetical protein A3L22_29770 [Streptomyces griseus subsp. griseus]|nr:hypothetical protein A3L22_29770 [Streptomyces griseus subsp. griseus]
MLRRWGGVEKLVFSSSLMTFISGVASVEPSALGCWRCGTCRHSRRISVSAQGRGGGVGWNSLRSRTNFGMLVDATLLSRTATEAV